MSEAYQDKPPLTQRLLFGYSPTSLTKKTKRRKYQTFVQAPHFEGLMKKYPSTRRERLPEVSYKQLELSFHGK